MRKFCPQRGQMKLHQQPTLFTGKEKKWEGVKWKHPQIREKGEDGPLSKVLESRGIRTLWVIFVVHKIAGLDGFRTFESNFSKVPL